MSVVGSGLSSRLAGSAMMRKAFHVLTTFGGRSIQSNSREAEAAHVVYVAKYGSQGLVPLDHGPKQAILCDQRNTVAVFSGNGAFNIYPAFHVCSPWNGTWTL